MSIPKENRQQMINLMYLVLTALLAINVSSEILNAFHVIDESMKKSGYVMDAKNKAVFSAFAAQKIKEPGNDSIEYFENKAKKAILLTDNLDKEINKLQKELFSKAGGAGEDQLMLKKDDIDIPTRLFVEGNKGKNNGKGYALKQKIENTLQQLLSMIDDESERKLLAENISLNTKSKTHNTDWVQENFSQMPAIAVQTLLTKISQDIKNTQGQFLEHFYKKIRKSVDLKPEDYIMNKFTARIAAPSSTILEGEPFMADVFLTASSDNIQNLTIQVNGQSIKPDENGVAQYLGSSERGEHILNGWISIQDKNTQKINKFQIEPFTYTVMAPSAAVSLDKMNVFYIGVENPVSINAAGLKNTDLQVSLSNGNISGNNGEYIVKVLNDGGSTLTITGKNGKKLSVKNYRTKWIPDPEPRIGNHKSGKMISAAEMQVQKGVRAWLENFDFNASFDVIDYTVGIVPKNDFLFTLENHGQLFEKRITDALKKIKAGDMVFVENIRVKGPDNKIRTLNSISYRIK